jgi:hypothetical protein
MRTLKIRIEIAAERTPIADVARKIIGMGMILSKAPREKLAAGFRETIYDTGGREIGFMSYEPVDIDETALRRAIEETLAKPDGRDLLRTRLRILMETPASMKTDAQTVEQRLIVDVAYDADRRARKEGT